MRHATYRDRYEDVVLRTKPVFYVAMQGNTFKEQVRWAAVTNNASVARYQGPFPGSHGMRFSSSTADNDSLSIATHTSYHPGDTFSVAGWFNRLGAGDAAGNVLIHLGANDFLIWFTSDLLTLRKAGVGNIIQANTSFASPYTKGWYHVAITKNAGTSTTLYLNGVDDGGATSNQTIVAAATDPTFGITAPAGTSNDFDGALSHWAIWDRVLSLAEVKDLYLSGRTQT